MAATTLYVTAYTKGGREVTRAHNNCGGVGGAVNYAVDMLADPEIPSVTIWRYRSDAHLKECLMRVMDATSAPKEAWADTREIVQIVARKSTRTKRI
jgi:hypothetical protein